jgi:SAM-dependent MidA family methyltransferase
LNPLVDHLKSVIKEKGGAISFCEWMRLSLYHYPFGYYNRVDHKRWGKRGDYRTSPELTALFAETFVRYYSNLFKDLGTPHQITFIEAGGGGGHFANRFLHALKRDNPDLFDRTSYIFSEISQHSRQTAQKLLDPFNIIFTSPDSLILPTGPVVLFSNELLDAFPVHRFVYKEDQFREFYVANSLSGSFEWIEKEVEDKRLMERLRKLPPLKRGQIFEINLAAEEWIENIAKSIKSGYLISVDYGDLRENLYNDPFRFHGTSRSYSQHELTADLLANPGCQDITSTVNWSDIIEAGTRCGLRTNIFTSLDKFLLEHGILDCIERLMPDSSDFEFISQAREMVIPGGMASHFQVLVQSSAGEVSCH